MRVRVSITDDSGAELVAWEMPNMLEPHTVVIEPSRALSPDGVHALRGFKYVPDVAVVAEGRRHL